MSVNIKINGQTVNDIHAVQFENADAPGTNIQFYDVNSVQEEKTVTPTTSVQEVVPSSGNLLSKVTVEGVTAEVDSNIQAQNIKEGVSILGVSGAMTNKLPQVVDRTVTTITDDDLAGISIIGNYAFSSCSGLTSITIPNSVTSIGGNAFLACEGLEEISLHNSITSIGISAFRGCSSLTSITIGNGVTSIGNTAFSFCSALTSFVIHTVTPPTLGTYVFDAVYNVTIYVPAESVDAYKSATNWSALASRIQAIPS